MADIELVIKIPEETYEYWKNHSHEYVLAEAIKNGTPLPKGHGRLIDADYMNERILELPIDELASENAWAMKVLCLAPTIIEADKEQKE